jgi:hypothetical protein
VVKFLSKYIIVESLLAKSWNSFLEKSTEGNFLQCFEYGEISLIANPRKKVARFSIMCDGEPVGIVQGTYTAYLGFGMTLSVDLGPIINPETAANLQHVGILLKELEAYCRKKRIIHLHFSVPDYLHLNDTFLKMNYTSTGRANDYVMNLNNGAQKLWLNIHHNKRRNIRTALKEGVEITQSHRKEDLKIFCSLYEVTAKKRGFIAYPRSFFEAIWKIYNPELSKVFLAHWKGKCVSGVFVVIHGKTVYALGAGSLATGWSARPNDLLHWKVMEWACENGYLKYNMGGVDEPPPTKGSAKWGVWRWKKEWKGSFEPLEIFDKIIFPQYKPMLQARDLAYRCIRQLKISI